MGSNYVPDLRDRFLTGAGYSYYIGQTGGASVVALDILQIPAHAHTRGSMNITGSFWGHLMGWDINSGHGDGAFYTEGPGDARSAAANEWQSTPRWCFDASRTWTGETSYVGGNQPHENRPPFYAVRYYIRAK